MINLPGDITLHWLDVAAIGFVLLSVLFGYFRGFTRELVAFVSWLAAAVLTHYTYDFNAAWISDNISGNELLVAGLAVGLVFVVFVILFSIIGSPLWRGVRRSEFWLIDRVLGLFVGLGRGIILVLIIWIAVAIGTQSNTKQQWAEQSETVLAIDQNSRKMIGWILKLPHELIQRDWIQNAIEGLESTMGPPLEEAAENPLLNIPSAPSAPSTQSGTSL